MKTLGTLAARVIELDPDPRSASQARRWVTEELTGRVSQEEIDSAVLAVSELVANAVMHARTRIWVGISADAPTVIEVCDLSAAWLAEQQRQQPDRHEQNRQEQQQLVADEEPASNGNGLSMISALASRWGVEKWGDGKRVWFEPRPLSEVGESRSPLIGERPMETARANTKEILFVDTPVELAGNARRYYRALRREVVLAAFHDSPGAGVPEMAEQFQSTVPTLFGADATLERAYLAESPVVTVRRKLTATDHDLCAIVNDLYLRAERLAHEGQLLTLPPPDDMVRLRIWFFGEIDGQYNGANPVPWADANG